MRSIELGSYGYKEKSRFSASIPSNRNLVMKTKTINTLRSIMKKNNTDSAVIQGKPTRQLEPY